MACHPDDGVRSQRVGSDFGFDASAFAAIEDPLPGAIVACCNAGQIHARTASDAAWTFDPRQQDETTAHLCCGEASD